MSVNKQTLQKITSRLTAVVAEFATSPGDETLKRMAIVSAAQDLLYEATLPQEQWIEQASIMGTMTASRLFLKWNAFDKIPADGTISYAELAKDLDAEESLIRRVGGMLVASRVLRQVGDDQIAHTPKSSIYTSSSPYTYMFRMVFDEILTPWLALPRYFDQYALREPQGPSNNPYTYANGQPSASVWDIMNQDPERGRIFMEAMKTAEAMMPMTGLYDYTWAKDEVVNNEERVVLVDVGGGKGHAVQAICDENGWLPRERCVVQDREDVVEQAKAMESELKGVKMMAHDFNTEQPIKGALIYHLRRCLHDYGDAICITMLRNIAEAMTHDSRLLIVEQVVGNPPSQMAAHFDFVMLTIGGKERTRKDFERLAGEAGLKVLEVHERMGAPVAVVECVKA